MSIDFSYDAERASQAALWLLKQHGHLDRIKLLKLVLLCDLRHLRKYGRPIVGGQYFAMEHGPVPSELYDQVKKGSLPGTEPVGSYQLKSVAEPDEDYLSETDLEVLHEINAKFGNWDTFRLRDLTHKLPAWKKNFKGGKSSSPIEYEDFFAGWNDRAQETLGLIQDAQDAERVLG